MNPLTSKLADVPEPFKTWGKLLGEDTVEKMVADYLQEKIVKGFEI